MKTNSELQTDVQHSIHWEPLLKASLIGVTAKDGVITLKGVVDLYAKKIEAENVAKTVKGVKIVIDEIEIEFDSTLTKSDNEIATELQNDMQWRQIPIDKVKVTVKEGWVTLEGEVEWNYQREIAKNAGNYIVGVKGINSAIKLEIKTHDQIEKTGIEQALARNSSLNSKNIHVEVLADRVILTGTVDSLHEKDKAESIVWKAPGVWNLNNQLEIKSVMK